VPHRATSVGGIRLTTSPFLEAGDGCTDRFDDPRSLEPESTGKLSRLHISVRAEHDLRSIQADALYIDLDFVGTWGWNIQILDFQYACITIFVEANDACHHFSSISVAIFITSNQCGKSISFSTKPRLARIMATRLS
jgi:hypothetical protein